MANSFFRFKQFTIWHDKCAMKVGTDGVLLGAWADIEYTQKILDVGTGTGLIALMLAQRSNAHIDAIDIDEGAFIQAQENIRLSPFGDRISVYHQSLQEYVLLSGKKYDLIVSNPPYFQSSLKGPDEQRNLARHSDMLPLETLLSESIPLLVPSGGRLALIIPIEYEEKIQSLCQQYSFYMVRKTTVYPKPDSAPKRILTELSLNPTVLPPVQNKLIVELNRHVYSEEYIALTRAFYLKM